MVALPECELQEFLHHILAVKPPYECPFPECKKAYRSYNGIRSHLRKDHDVPMEEPRPAQQREPSPPPLNPGPQRFVQIELEGQMRNMNVLEPLQVFSCFCEQVFLVLICLIAFLDICVDLESLRMMADSHYIAYVAKKVKCCLLKGIFYFDGRFRLSGSSTVPFPRKSDLLKLSNVRLVLPKVRMKLAHPVPCFLS